MEGFNLTVFAEEDIALISLGQDGMAHFTSADSLWNIYYLDVVLYDIPIFSCTVILKLLPYYIFVTYTTRFQYRRYTYYRGQYGTVCKLIVPCAKSRRYLPYMNTLHVERFGFEERGSMSTTDQEMDEE